MNLKRIVKFKNIKDCIGASLTIRRVTIFGPILVKYENGDLARDSHSVLAGWRKHFSQLLNVHGVNEFRQRDTHRRATSA